MNIPVIPGIPPFAYPGYNALFEPALNNKFVIYIPPKTLTPDADAMTLVLACRNANIPAISIGTVTDTWFQYTFRYHSASTPTGGTVSFTFRGYMNPNDPAYILLQWVRKAVEVIPQSGPESYFTGSVPEYMTNAYLFQLTHKNVPWRIIKYVGIFPTGTPAVSLAYGTGSLISYSVSFAYQWIELVFSE